MHFRRPAGTLTAALIVAGAVACTDTPTIAPEPALSVAQADSVAAVVVADLDGVPEGAVIDLLGGPRPAAPAVIGAGHCVPQISPMPPLNSDDDPIPDSVRFEFIDCTWETRRGTFSRFGIIDLFDLDPLVAGHHIRAKFIDFGSSVTRNEETFTVVHNGERRFSASATQLLHQEIDFLTEFSFPDGSSGSHLRDWSSIFTADPGGAIGHGRLPAGTWEVNGTSTWTKGDRSWSLAVTTLTPLHFDPACDARPRFDAGAVQVVATRGDQTSTITIEFTGCGEYTVTRE